MSGLLPGRAITRRVCGGTPLRPSYTYELETFDARKLEYGTEKKHVPSQAAQPGCSSEVAVQHVHATRAPADGSRALFAKSAPVVLCPHCDAPGPALDLEA
jgi:hypothetical protein